MQIGPKNQPPQRHPARRTTRSTAGLLASRVSPFAAFPGLFPVAMARAPKTAFKALAWAHRLQLRGQPRIWSFLDTAFPVRSK